MRIVSLNLSTLQHLVKAALFKLNNESLAGYVAPDSFTNLSEQNWAAGRHVKSDFESWNHYVKVIPHGTKAFDTPFPSQIISS